MCSSSTYCDRAKAHGKVAVVVANYHSNFIKLLCLAQEFN